MNIDCSPAFTLKFSYIVIDFTSISTSTQDKEDSHILFLSWNDYNPHTHTNIRLSNSRMIYISPLITATSSTRICVCKYNIHAETHFGKFAHRNYDSDSQCFWSSSRRSEMFNLLSNFQDSHQMPFVFYWFSLHGFVFVTLSFERTTAASIIFFLFPFSPPFSHSLNSSFHFNPICTPLQTKLSSNPRRTRMKHFFLIYVFLVRFWRYEKKRPLPRSLSTKLAHPFHTILIIWFICDALSLILVVVVQNLFTWQSVYVLSHFMRPS